MFFAINSTTNEKVNSLTIQENVKMLLKGRDGNYFWGCCRYPLCKVTSSYVK